MFFLQWKKHKETNNINKIKWMNKIKTGLIKSKQG